LMFPSKVRIFKNRFK